METSQILSRSEGVITVSQLAQLYVKYLDGYYGVSGRGEFRNQRSAISQWAEFAGEILADQVGPRQIKAWREGLVSKGRERKYVNRLVRYARRMFRWGVEEELIDPRVSMRLNAVADLQFGRSQARESDPVEPVSLEIVQRTLPELRPVMRDMVMAQYEMAARPGEIVRLRPDGIDCTDSECWVANYKQHKTRHRGRRRLLHIGPRAQQYLQTYMQQPDWCFVNRDGRPYTTNRYGENITRAARRAGLPLWTPNQLRHAKETAVRREYNLEAAQVYAGHARADVTEIYAQRDMDLARKVAKEFG